MPPGRRHALLAGLSVLFTLVGLEIVLRVAGGWVSAADPEAEPGVLEPALGMGWVPRLGARSSEVSASGDTVWLQISSTGQRGNELPAAMPAELRLLFLGDSVTFGASVPKELTFVSRIGDRLRAHGRQVVAINGGVPGYSTYQELAYYRYVATPLRPDVVVLMFFNGNDFRDNMIHTLGGEIVSPALLGGWRPTDDGDTLRSPDSLPDPLSGAPLAVATSGALAALERISFAARLFIGRAGLLRDRSTADMNRLDPVSRYYYYEIGLFQQRQDSPFDTARDLALTCLKSLHRQVLDEGAELLVVTLPSRNQVDAEAWSSVLTDLGVSEGDLGELDLDAPDRIVGEACRVLGVPVTSLTTTFRNHPDPAALYHGTHLSPQGHAVVAEQIAAFLEQHSVRLDDPGHSQLHAAADALHEGDPDLAMHEADRLLEHQGPRLDALRLLGAAQRQAGLSQQAVASLTMAVNMDSASAVLRTDLAEALLATRDTTAAISLYMEALQLRPAWWTYHARLADLQAAVGDPAQASAHAQEAQHLAWDDEVARLGWGEEHLLRGRAFLQQELWSRAETELRHAAVFRRESPQVAELDYLLGVVFMSSGRVDSATAYLSRVRVDSEWYAEATVELAACEQRRGDLVRAAELLAAAAASSGTAGHIESFSRIGARAVLDGGAERVVLACRRLLAARDGAQRVRLLMAVGLHVLKRYAESIHACRLVIADPRAHLGMAHIQMARSLEALGRVHDAQQVYGEVVAADGSWLEGDAPAAAARRRLAREKRDIPK
jgi:tetratricopeptide (TPR) repeat protein